MLNEERRCFPLKMANQPWNWLFTWALLSFVLCSQQGSNGGQIVFGGVDENLYTGELTWIPVTQELYWQITIDE